MHAIVAFVKDFVKQGPSLMDKNRVYDELAQRLSGQYNEEEWAGFIAAGAEQGPDVDVRRLLADIDLLGEVIRRRMTIPVSARSI